MSNTHNYINALDVFGDLVFRTTDAWGDILVIDSRRYRNLTFGSIYDQSSMDRKKPHVLIHEYTRAMVLILAFMKPQHATILGLGGGCLLRSLYHVIPKCKFHVVELRQQVYDVASEFFGMPTSKNITVTISDAKQQLNEAEECSTNIIFADMYHAAGMNLFQVQKHFLKQCHRVLSKKGWLVVNYCELSNLNTPFFKYLSGLFSDVFVCSIPGGNSVIFASKHRVKTLSRTTFSMTALEKKLEIKLTHLLKKLKRVSFTEEDDDG